MKTELAEASNTLHKHIIKHDLSAMLQLMSLMLKDPHVTLTTSINIEHWIDEIK